MSGIITMDTINGIKLLNKVEQNKTFNGFPLLKVNRIVFMENVHCGESVEFSVIYKETKYNKSVRQRVS